MDTHLVSRVYGGRDDEMIWLETDDGAARVRASETFDGLASYPEDFEASKMCVGRKGARRTGALEALHGTL